jgi:dihydroneopterin aldolase
MADKIVLANMRFPGRHGVLEEEIRRAQPFEVDVELFVDLRAAGQTDDLTQTVDYREAFDICRGIIEGPSHRLIEAVAETIATRLLTAFGAAGVSEVVVRVRKPEVALPGELDAAAVEIRRRPANP